MPSPAHLSRSSAATSVSPALAALGEVASVLASGAALGDMVPRVLEPLRELVSARECALWLAEAGGGGSLRRAWGVGADATSGEEVASALATTAAAAGRLLVTPVESAGRRLGALVVRASRALREEDRVAAVSVATMLAPRLVFEEHARALETEVALRTRQIDEQRVFTQNIIDSLPVGLYVIDREYRIQAWNRKRETGMQGVSREEAIGRTIFEILHRQPAELLRREFDDVFTTGRIQQFQTESEASGELRVYRLTKIPMRLGGGQVTHVITIGEDVTDWKEAEARIAQTEKLAAMGTLAAGVMHEINNPLATIAACAESMALRLGEAGSGGAGLGTDFTDYLAIIDGEVRRCKNIADGVLDFSRPRPATKEPVDVNTLLERTLFLLKHHARFKKLTVQTQLEAGLEPVRGNPEQLVQVFMALLLNAVDAMDEHGTVMLRTTRGRRSDEAVIAEVSDTGTGIKRSELNKIFEPFYTTKPPGRGTGLGLSICYGIIAEHGGRLEVESTFGQGSTFRIVLPAAGTTRDADRAGEIA